MTAEETPSPTPSTLVATSDFAAPPAVYVALAVLHTVFVCVILVAYYLRRNLQPLKARGTLLTFISTIYGMTHFFVLAIAVSGSPGVVTNCNVMVADIIFSDLFLPVWAQPFLMRAGLLIFTLNVQRATVSPVSGSQRLQDLKTRLFSMRSYLYDTRLQLASVIFMGLLHFFINFALTVNNGPLSEEPCSIHPSVYVVAVFGVFYIFILAVCAVYAYSINDIYHIKKELAVALVVTIPMLIMWVFTTEILIQYNIIFVLAEIFFADIICVLVPLLMTFRPYWVQFNNGLADARPMSAVMDSTFNDMRLHEKTDDSSSAYSFGHDGEIVKLDADGGEHQIRAGDTATDSPQDEHKSSHARKDALKPKPSLQQCDIDESATLIDYLRDPVFLAEFTSFCVRAFCAESISFFLDMQRKQQIKKMDQEARAKEVKYLFETYIEVGAPKELNITDVARKELTATYQKCNHDIGMFESTLKDTYWLMKTNLFPAWKKDRGFQALREKLVHSAPSQSKSSFTDEVSLTILKDSGSLTIPASALPVVSD